MSFFVQCKKCNFTKVSLIGEMDCVAYLQCIRCGYTQYSDESFEEEVTTTHKQVVDLFNEILDALKAEYGAYNSERGEMRVNSDGITERERMKLHSYRKRLNDIYIP